ncbi:MAG: hypothetical protein K2J11_11005 [Oscillospiraceae bacterium]|nr:hypothetical protein [Oscillospiraceae bacterium]
MSKFQFEVNVEPKDIPKLDDAHKRDCADALRNVINQVFKYTLIYSVGVMAFFGAYSLFGFTYLMRMEKMLPQINLFIPLLALAVFLLEFIAGTMNKAALIIEVILNLALIFAVIPQLQTVWIAPFALYAAVIHIKLISFIPFHKTISEQPGYPEFTSLPTRDEIVLKKEDAPSEEKSGDGTDSSDGQDNTQNAETKTETETKTEAETKEK